MSTKTMSGGNDVDDYVNVDNVDYDVSDDAFDG